MSTPIHSSVEGRLAAVMSAMGIGDIPARLVPCPSLDLGDAAIAVALPAARILRRSPVAIAADIAAQVGSFPEIETAVVASPGYVNVRFGREALDRAMDGFSPEQSPMGGARTLVDFGGPNVAKPLHVGHLRSLVIGESLRRIMTASGRRVVSDVHLGDWGLQMGMLLSQAEEEGVELATVGLDELERLYRDASEACKRDERRLASARAATASLQAGDASATRSWTRMRSVSVAAIEAQSDLLGARFDRWLGESDAAAEIPGMIKDLRERGIAVESEGALVVPVGGDVPPLLVAKADGAALYGTTDLATLRSRVSEGFGRIVYCADSRQALHFRQVFSAARLAGYAGEDVELKFVGFGTVNGKDGRPFKTRDGGVARLADLLGEATAAARVRISASEQASALASEDRESLARALGVASLKFADLSSHPSTGYVFDPARMTAAEGRTGPYIQYACARIASILAKAEAAGLAPAAPRPRTDEERSLALSCLGFDDALATAAEELAPVHVAEHAFDVAQKFSRFYATSPVIGAADGETAAGRLGLCIAALRVLSLDLEMLGIEVPDAM